MKICILVPVHNEAVNLGAFLEALGAKYSDVVVVDDGSTDGSGRIAQGKGATVIRNPNRTGKGLSLRKGFAYIVEKHYDAVMTMDGDGQHAVEDIGKILHLAKQYPLAVIVGNRMCDVRRMPWIRYLTNRLMSGLISMVCRQSIPDTQCGFRYIHCDILKSLDLQCRDFEIETEIIMKASKKGVPIYSVPIKTIYEDEESHIRPLKDTIKFLHYFLKEIFHFS